MYKLRLPGINGVAPLPGILEAVSCDLPGVLAIGPIKAGVVAIPSSARSELHDRHVPGDRHRHNALLARLERESHCDGSRKFLSAADPGLVVIRQAAIFRDRSPHLIAGAIEKRGVVGDLDAGSLSGRNRPLAVEVVLYAFGMH